MKARTVSDSRSILVRWMGPGDANAAGYVHGGHSRHRVVTENPRTGDVSRTNSAYLTMVALDDDGRPAAVPALDIETDEERRRESEAQLRRSNRLAEREQIVAARDA